MARWFHVDLTEVKYVEVDKERFVALEGTVDGDLMVKGNIVVTGKLEVMGGICSCLGVAETKQTRARNAKGQIIKG